MIDVGVMPKEGKTVAKPETADPAKIMGPVGRSAAEILGLPDAYRALRGQMTEDEAQGFALTAGLGLLPGAKVENALTKGATKLATSATSAAGSNLLTKATGRIAKLGAEGPQGETDPLIQALSQGLNEYDWAHGGGTYNKLPSSTTHDSIALPNGTYSLAPHPFSPGEHIVLGPEGNKVADIFPVPNGKWTVEHTFGGQSNLVDTPGQGLTSAAIAHAGMGGPVSPGFHEMQAGAGGYPPIDETAISNALAKNPGASIFDVAGTHVGGPSSSLSEAMDKWGVQKTIHTFPEETFHDLPRQEGLSYTPLGARILGNTTNTGHATRLGESKWETPSGVKAIGAGADPSADALRLPDDEIGVHFGNSLQNMNFSGSTVSGGYLPRTYPVVIGTNNPLRMRDLGAWHPEKIEGELRRLNGSSEYKGQFADTPNSDDIKDYRDYLSKKGYDSIVYQNSEEDPGHDSYIKFTPSPHAPEFVAGVRSPFAKFDPNKLSWPELAAGVGGGIAGTGLMFDENGNPIVRTK